MTRKSLTRADEIAYYVKLPYAIDIKADECGGQVCYIAEHPELYGCMAQGDTPGEAVRNLREAREEYIAALLEAGVEVPQPKWSPTLTSLDIEVWRGQAPAADPLIQSVNNTTAQSRSSLV